MKRTTITINGLKKTLLDYKKNYITYDLILRMTGKNPKTAIYTVTFSKGYTGQSEGTLTPGEKVKLKDGMIFDAYYTGAA